MDTDESLVLVCLSLVQNPSSNIVFKEFSQIASKSQKLKYFFHDFHFQNGSGQDNEMKNFKKRTKNCFLMFCEVVLKHEGIISEVSRNLQSFFFLILCVFFPLLIIISQNKAKKNS